MAITKVKEIIADALYLEPGEVDDGANLMKDLGAESIDFLDIIFRLENEFGIKIPRGEMERRARGDLSEDAFAVDGRLTKAAIEQLRRAMPEVDPTNIKEGIYVREIPSLFTVESFSKMVTEQLAANTKTGVRETSASA